MGTSTTDTAMTISVIVNYIFVLLLARRAQDNIQFQSSNTRKHSHVATVQMPSKLVQSDCRICRWYCTYLYCLNIRPSLRLFQFKIWLD